MESFQAVRDQAIDTLPEVARNSLSKGGEDRSFVTIIRDQDGAELYRATLTFKGEYLIDRKG